VPYVSQAQRRKFHADPKLRPMAAEWDAATPKGAKLPEHVKGGARDKRHQKIKAGLKRAFPD
jgi:hypothetical protein